MYLIISTCSKTSEKIIGMHVFHVIKITLIKGFAFTKHFDIILEGTRKTSDNVRSTAQWNGRFDTPLFNETINASSSPAADKLVLTD